MVLNKNIFICIIAISITSFGISQNKNTVFTDTIIPKSIYLAKPDFLYFNSNFNLDKRLQLNNFNFVFLNEKDIEDGYNVIPLTRLWNPPSSYIFDTYQKIYNNMNLKKSFFKVSDLYNKPYNPKK